MIKENLNSIRCTIPENVTLVAVSKTKPSSDIQEAYDSGERIFGENKIQEMVGKHDELPKDIQWHMIGHLQRNKVKYMAEFVDLIHGVDSFKTLKEINKQAKKYSRNINCLLQVHIGEEETKFGLSSDEVTEILTSEEYQSFDNTTVVGLMGMATFTDNKTQVKAEFTTLKSLYDTLKEQHGLETLSMGMSGDYQLAIECGSTMVRIGSSIFGNRNYK